METTDIIACRSLESHGRIYKARIGRPRPAGERGYACTISLVDDEGSAMFSVDIYGVDSMQALIYAVAIIGARIPDELEDLSWLGEIPGTGLPRHVDAKKQPGIISIYTDLPEILGPDQRS